MLLESFAMPLFSSTSLCLFSFLPRRFFLVSRGESLLIIIEGSLLFSAFRYCQEYPFLRISGFRFYFY